MPGKLLRYAFATVGSTVATSIAIFVMSAVGSRQTHRNCVAAYNVWARVAPLAAGVGVIDPAGNEYWAPGVPTTAGSFSGQAPKESTNGVEAISTEQSVGIDTVEAAGTALAETLGAVGVTLGTMVPAALEGPDGGVLPAQPVSEMARSAKAMASGSLFMGTHSER
ncbi:hypothetical protein GCM10009563_10300 [Subtercola frigoramans]